MKIINLTLEVTNRCNMRCAMCGIWEEKQKKELSVKEVSTLFHHPQITYPVGSVSLTGGEVFLHSKLDTLYRYLYLMKRQKKVAAIDIVTSGYLTEQILGFLERNKEYLWGLEMDISLDGLEEKHTMQRGWPDAWARTWRTIDAIKALYPSVRITAKYTINALNIDDIMPVYTLCMQRGIAFLPKFVEQGTTAYYHRVPKQHSLFMMTEEKRTKALAIIQEIACKEKDKKRAALLKELVALKGMKENVTTCGTPEQSLFVTADGSVHACIYMQPIGNVFSPLVLENACHAEQVARGRGGTCPKCIAYHGYLRSWNCRN
ncbi:radical SAM protein [Candidatus Woesearchaeota archaeon]|nr:radical SAM protein [Candidatus Woesearchaeota archaeon]